MALPTGSPIQGLYLASYGKNSGICAPNCRRCGVGATTLGASGMSRKRPCGATSRARRDGSKCGKRNVPSLPTTHRRMPLTANWVKPVASTMRRSKNVGTPTRVRRLAELLRSGESVQSDTQRGRFELANFGMQESCAESRRPSKPSSAMSKRVSKLAIPASSLGGASTVHVPQLRGWMQTDGTRLYLQGVGHIKVKLHRPIAGAIKTVTVKRACGTWYACLSVDYAAEPLPVIDTRTGLDVGLTAFATLADGTEVENPRCYRRAQARLRLAQRRVARRKRGGKNRRKAVVLLQKAHAKVMHQRSDFQHKVAQLRS